MSTINDDFSTIQSSVQTNLNMLLVASTKFISFFDEHYLAEVDNNIPYLKQLMKDKVVRGISHD